ncbi:hypothetical protein [Nocardia blacklockiae]|uniref:hypothetical protein n=1 Tax=Nocardia blacklockiae TaxID=480036 RepID=UPI001894EC51|nr:hypothetical protein [Nocardia blacklockiae]MBF6171557.1 hypothetical protein [Nocardia blacklockiae]
MYRTMLKVAAAGAFSVAIAMQPMIAVASPEAAAREPEGAARTQATAPFDPICPLCFVRELIESGSGR